MAVEKAGHLGSEARVRNLPECALHPLIRPPPSQCSELRGGCSSQQPLGHSEQIREDVRANTPALRHMAFYEGLHTVILGE